MCYRPLSTGMERVKVLSNIRTESISFPEDFDEVNMPNQVCVTLTTGVQYFSLIIENKFSFLN